MLRTILCAIAGFLYGAGLTLLGLLATGAGHGTYVILGLASSPFSLLDNVLIALLGAPLLWTGVGILLGLAEHRGPRIGFFLTLLAHYGCLAIVLRSGSHFGDWSYAAKQMNYVYTCIGIYALGQIALWTTFVLLVLRRQPQRG